jgi:O-antigen/teichoic acid export membrane protein
MTLKAKTISGFKWSLIDTFFRYFLTFFISIILARLLSPSDYGLVGMAAIFISISRVFIDGGFSDALIRKVNCSVEDYSSVLIFNFAIALFFYIILFITSEKLSIFFNQPELVNIIKISGLGLIIGALASVHTVYLKKIINFKMQAKIGLASTLIAGIIAVIMAFNNYGFWSLVFSGLFQSTFTTILLWLSNNELKVKLSFKIEVIKEHFRFGSKIMFGSLLHVIYNNMHYALIGKLFNTSTLGYYTRADNFQKLFSDNIDIIVRQVTYPVLAQLQNEESKLKATYQIMLRTATFINFIILMGLFTVAQSFIVILIGEKWLPSVPYLQLLCFAGLFIPLISINTNILNVKGRSDLSLKLVIIKIILSLPSLLMGYYLGIFAMIIGILISLLITYFFVIYFTNQVIDYNIKEQFLDILPSIKIAVFSLTPVYLIGYFLTLSSFYLLLVQLLVGFVLIIVFGELLNNKEYLIIKNLAKSSLKKIKNV